MRKKISCLWNTQSDTNQIIFSSIVTIICMVFCILLLRVQEQIKGEALSQITSAHGIFFKQKGHCSDSYWDMAKIWNRNIWGRLPDHVNSSNVFSLSYTSFISWDGTTQIAITNIFVSDMPNQQKKTTRWSLSRSAGCVVTLFAFSSWSSLPHVFVNDRSIFF